MHIYNRFVSDACVAGKKYFYLDSGKISKDHSKLLELRADAMENSKSDTAMKGTVRTISIPLWMGRYKMIDYFIDYSPSLPAFSKYCRGRPFNRGSTVKSQSWC